MLLPRVPERILFVDDDAVMLDALRRQFRRHFLVDIAVGGRAGLEVLQHEGPSAAVVSDQQMPGMNGTQFLSEVRRLAPATMRILLTGQSDLQSAIQAVDQGEIFRFRTKPCPRTALQSTLEAAIEQLLADDRTNR